MQRTISSVAVVLCLGALVQAQPSATTLQSHTESHDQAPTTRASDIRFVPGPTDGPQLALGAAARFAGAPASAKLEPALPIYTLTLSARGGLEDAVNDNRFRYYATADGKQVASVVIVFDSTTGVWRVSSTGLQPRVDFAQAIDRLPSIEQVRAGSYEARLLSMRVQGNTYEVVWLKSDLVGSDLLYPVADYYQHGIEPGKLYSPDDLFGLLVPARTGRPATVSGSARYANGKAAAHVNVVVADQNYNEVVKVVSDGDGSFAADVPRSGSFNVGANAGGLVAPWQLTVLSLGTRRTLGNPVVLQEPGSVSGTVVDDQGMPAADVAIAFTQPSPTPTAAGKNVRLGRDGGFVQAIAAGTTDAQGAFTIKKIFPGEFIILASLRSDGAEQLGFVQPVVVISGTSTPLAAPIKLVRTGSISGTVVDAAGNRLANAAISYVGLWTSESGTGASSNVVGGLSSARTDGSGAFTLTGIPPGFYRVNASTQTGAAAGAGGSLSSIEVKGDAQTVLPAPIKIGSRASAARGG